MRTHEIEKFTPYGFFPVPAISGWIWSAPCASECSPNPSLDGFRLTPTYDSTCVAVGMFTPNPAFLFLLSRDLLCGFVRKDMSA